MKFWIGPYQEGEVGGIQCRHAPAGAVGTIGVGESVLFSAPDGLKVVSDYKLLGSGIPSEIKDGKSLFASLAGVEVEGDSLDEWLWTALTQGASCLMPTTKGRLNLWFANATLRTIPFKLDCAEAAPVIARLQEQYRTIREASRTMDGDGLHYLRVLDYWGKKYRCDCPEDVFIPDDLPKETAVKHATTYTDDFNRTDADALGANWTEVTGDTDILSNAARCTGSTNYNRYDPEVSSDDMYGQIVVTTNGPGNRNHEVYCRFGPAGENFMRAIFRTNSTDTFRLGKHISGSFTNLGTLNESVPSAPNTLRIESDGSDHSFIVNGVTKVTASDGDITGFMRGGFGSTGGVSSANFDDFETGDLDAGGSVESGAGSASGTSTASGVGRSTAAASGSSAGVGAASGVGRSTAAAAGSAAGVATVSGVGENATIGEGEGVGLAAGTSSVSGVGASIASAVGTAAGTSTISGVSDFQPIEVAVSRGGLPRKRKPEHKPKSTREIVSEAVDALNNKKPPTQAPVPAEAEAPSPPPAPLPPVLDQDAIRLDLAALEAAVLERQLADLVMSRQRAEDDALIILLSTV